MCLQSGNYIQVDYINWCYISTIKIKISNAVNAKNCLMKAFYFKINVFITFELLVQKLGCPKCYKHININDADLHLDRILTLKIQQTENLKDQQQGYLEPEQQIIIQEPLNQGNKEELPSKPQKEMQNNLFKVKYFEQRQNMNLEECICAICGLNFRDFEQQAQLQCLHVFHIKYFQDQLKESADCVLCQNVY
ncbi:unnamed protein product [Paramecium octaurelia]|uniref:RING-type domain-containing protein n=1 Tax=Paramecium octaurelia TaxID=43137 RepID=A0A8S1Y1R3_PAROT|nr:unnamed protein product [Paramecium octaurelia]CAD8207308.1 unnamed protein product [Paramecium octaurelia]